jgi:hypothetical protein
VCAAAIKVFLNDGDNEEDFLLTVGAAIIFHVISFMYQ